MYTKKKKRDIGYGSSAIVYKAIYKPTNKRMALKMLDLDMFERNQIDELRVSCYIILQGIVSHLLYSERQR